MTTGNGAEGLDLSKGYSADQLVGGWAPGGEPCDSDAGIDYGKDGTWQSYGEGGTWTLAGKTLTLVTLERGEPGEDSIRLKPPEKHDAEILSLDATAMKQRFDDGTIMPFKRCGSSSSGDSASAAEPYASSASGAVPASMVGGAKDGMKYRDVRKRILSAGFRIVARPEDQFCGYSPSCTLPETDACAGAGQGQCSYIFAKGGQRIQVSGIGEYDDDPYGQDVISITYE